MDRQLRASPPAAAAGLSRRTWVGLFLAGLAPRLALALVFLRFPIGLDDMYQYDMLARSIASGNGYRWYAAADVEPLRPYLEKIYGWDFNARPPLERGFTTTFRAPGYPFFLAGIYLLSGFTSRFAAARLAQAVMGAALAPLTAWLALRLRLPPRAAKAAGLTLALYPVLWSYPLGLGSENLFLPLVVLGLVGLLRSADEPRPISAVWGGLAFAAATLTRSTVIAFLPLAAIWLCRRQTLRHSVVLVGVYFAALLPWSIRNSLVNGRPTFVETGAAYRMFIGYHPEGQGIYDRRIAVIPLQILDDGERDHWSFQQALGFIRADPGRVPELLLRRLAFFWGMEDGELIFFYGNGFFGPIAQPWLLLAYLILFLPWVVLAASAPFGLAHAWTYGDRGRQNAALVLLLVGVTLAAYLPILTDPRFHLPLVPALACFSAVTWTTPGIMQGLLLRGESAFRLALLAAVLFLVLCAGDSWRELPELVRIMSPGGHELHLDF